jgi:hypothetical protein
MSGTRKRCAKGSRKDKITGECVKYTQIKVLENVNDEIISKMKRTLTLESLNDDGAIIKYYKDGKLYEQTLVDKKRLDKINTSVDKEISKLIKLLHKVKRNPSMIKKDKGFKKLLKREENMFSGGGEKIKESDIEILIDEKVIEKDENNKISRMEDKIEYIQEKINNEKDTWWRKWFDDEWNNIHKNWKGLLTLLHLGDTIGLSSDFISTSFNLSLLPDLMGSLTVIIMNVLTMYYPGEDMEKYSEYTQYIVYTYMLGTSIFVNGSLFLIPNVVIIGMFSSFSLYVTVLENIESDETNLNNDERELNRRKKRLVDMIEEVK